MKTQTKGKIYVGLRSLTVFVIFGLMAMSCEKRVYLSEKEIAWNPYRAGQRLVFQSAGDRYDTVSILQTSHGHFPDGIGAPGNEQFKVLASEKADNTIGKDEFYLLYLEARWQEDPPAVHFEFALPAGRSFRGKSYPMPDLEKLEKISVETPYGTFSDVIAVKDNSGRFVKDNNIKVVFWSRANGYVKFEQYDGKTGELVDIIEQ